LINSHLHTKIPPNNYHLVILGKVLSPKDGHVLVDDDGVWATVVHSGLNRLETSANLKHRRATSLNMLDHSDSNFNKCSAIYLRIVS